MSKMKNLLKLLIILSFLTESSGVSYARPPDSDKKALRPIAAAKSDFRPSRVAIARKQKQMALRMLDIKNAADNPAIFRSTTLTGKLLRHILRYSKIELHTGGDAFSGCPAFMERLLTSISVPNLKTPPGEIPRQQEISLSQLPSYESLDDLGLVAGCVLDRSIKTGRTVVYQTEGQKFRAIHILQTGENAGELRYKSEFLGYLKEHKDFFGLLGECPTPKMIGNRNERVVRVRQLPQEAMAFIEEQQRESGEAIQLDYTDGYYTIMAYETDTPDYFRYLSDPTIPDSDFEESCLKNLHDLFILARYGIVHTALLRLFHCRGQQDTRRYFWMLDAIIEDNLAVERLGPGKISAWTGAVQYCNPRLSGIADLAHLDTIANLMIEGNPGSAHIFPFIRNRYGEKTANFYLAAFLGEYLLSIALIKAYRLREKERLSWDDKSLIADAANSMSNYFDYAYSVFTGRMSVDNISTLIDWNRLARQEAFYMAREHPYASFLKQARLPKGVYERNARIVYDPLGYSGSRDWIETGNKKGWYDNGLHPNLGPTNGPMPITELVKALYLYSGFMTAGIAKSQTLSITTAVGYKDTAHSASPSAAKIFSRDASTNATTGGYFGANMSRRQLLKSFLVIAAGTGIILGAPPLIRRYIEHQMAELERTKEEARRKILEALQHKNYFVEEISRLDLPKNLRINQDEINIGVQNFVQAVTDWQIELVSDEGPGSLVFGLVPEHSTLIVMEPALDGFVASADLTMLHESVHLSPFQVARDKRISDLSAALNNYLQPYFDERAVRIYGRAMRRQLKPEEIVGQGLWDPIALKRPQLRSLAKELIRQRWLQEAESYFIQVSAHEVRAKQKGLSLQEYLNKLAAPLIKGSSIESILKTELEFAKAYRPGEISPEFQELVFEYILRNPAHDYVTTLTIALAQEEFENNFSPQSFGRMDNDEQYRARFFKWVRENILGTVQKGTGLSTKTSEKLATISVTGTHTTITTSSPSAAKISAADNMQRQADPAIVKLREILTSNGDNPWEFHSDEDIVSVLNAVIELMFTNRELFYRVRHHDFNRSQFGILRGYRSRYRQRTPMHLTEGEKRTACAILSQLLDRVQYLLGEKIEGRRRLHERIATPSERVQREDELSIIVKAVGAERWQRALELQAAQQDGGSLTDEESRFLSSVITEAQRAVNGTGSSVHECPVDIVDFYTAIDKSA